MMPAMATASPFPGMDPWLERHWESVHFTYVQECRRQLVDQLPDGLFAEVEETVYIVDPDGDPLGTVRPDAAVFGHRPDAGDGPATTADGGTALAAAPVRIRLSAEPAVVTHVAVRSVRGGEPLVTAVEVISPTNKLSRDARRQYRRKRRAYRWAGASVVEVDLVRRGRHLVDVPAGRVADAAPPTAYRAVVRRAVRDGAPIEAEYYPLPLRQRLSVIRVPLRMGDPDVLLDLQQPVDAAYLLGGYGRRLDYARPPDPPLSADDAAWAAACVAAGR